RAQADQHRAARRVDPDRKRIAGELVGEEVLLDQRAAGERAAGEPEREPDREPRHPSGFSPPEEFSILVPRFARTTRTEKRSTVVDHHGSSCTVAARPSTSTVPPGSQQLRCRYASARVASPSAID